MAVEASARIAFLKRHLRGLGHTLNVLHEQERITPGAYVDEINSIKAQVQQFTTEKYQEALIRSRTRRFLEEQPSEQALSNERQAALAKGVLQIQYDGNNYSDTPGIVAAFCDYYAHLFGGGRRQTSGSDLTRFYDAFPRLDEEQRAVIEGLPSLDEVKSAISGLQGQESPGPVGLSSEF